MLPQLSADADGMCEPLRVISVAGESMASGIGSGSESGRLSPTVPACVHKRLLGELMVPQMVAERDEAERQAALAQRSVLLRNLGVLDLVHKYGHAYCTTCHACYACNACYGTRHPLEPTYPEVELF